MDELRYALVRIINDINEKLVDMELRVSQLEQICGNQFRPGAELAEMVERHFSLEEMSNLAFDLGLDGAVGGETRGERARAMVGACERRNMVGELVGHCRRARPKVDW